MAQIKIWGATYSDVPAVDLPTSNNTTARFMDTTDADATASDITSGKTAYVNNVKVIGTNSGGAAAGSVYQDSDGYLVLDDDSGGRYDPSDATATASDILSPKTAYISGGKVTGQIATKTSSDLSASGATVTVPAGYYASAASKSVDSGSLGNPTWTNEKTSTTFKITGTYSNFSEGYISSVNPAVRTFTLQEETVTPSTSQQVITPSTANAYLNKVTVEAMPSGTAGTPTATKGTVSNHQVSVTPSVTNTTGYITGSTKTGTAVTVSASELVSGSETKTSNGTYDVTNLASLVVNVSGGGGDSWTFTGKNPVKIQEWSEHTSFKTLGADSWTYSTSSTTTLRAVTSLSPTITCDYTNYDYVVLFKIKVSYDYGDWNPVAAITDFAYASVFYSIGYCGTLSAVESATQNSTTYTSSARYRAFYNNSNGAKALGDSTYGLYSSSAPQVSGSGTSSSMVNTFKKPVVYIRGNATYFSETAFNNLDMDNSFYDMKMELWRVDKATTDRAWVENQIVDLLNNGI